MLEGAFGLVEFVHEQFLHVNLLEVHVELGVVSAGIGGDGGGGVLELEVLAVGTDSSLRHV